MARTFVAANSHRYLKAVAPVTTYPFTIAAWFRPVDITTEFTIFSIGDTATTDNWWSMVAAGHDGDVLRFHLNDSGSFGAADSDTTYAADVWSHGCVVSTTATNRVAYLNANPGLTNTSDRTPDGADTIAIGIRVASSLSKPFGGRIAHVGLWNKALDQLEIDALAAGVPVHRVRPADNVGDWPLWGLHSPEIDLSTQNNALTVGGTGEPAIADGPPVGMFTRAPNSIFVPAVAGGGGALMSGSSRGIGRGIMRGVG